MRVLVLTPKLPWPLTGGAEIRNFNLLKETAKRHEVVLLSFLANPGDRDHFPALAKHCRSVAGLDLVRPAWTRALNAARSCATSAACCCRARTWRACPAGRR